MLKTLFEIIKREDSLRKKLEKIVELIKYYKNLQRGIKTGQIYHHKEHQDPDIVDFMDNFSDDDLNFIEKIFYEDVKMFLRKQKLLTFLDFKKKLGLKQIGLNSIFLKIVFSKDQEKKDQDNLISLGN